MTKTRFEELVEGMPELEVSVLASSCYPSKWWFMKEDIQNWIWSHIQQPVLFWWQRRTRGWDDSDTWNLDYTIAKLVEPRLRRMKELGYGHPSTMSWEEWQETLDKILWAFDYILNEDDWKHIPESEKMTGREMEVLVPLTKIVVASEEEKTEAEAKFARFCQVEEQNQKRCQEGLDLFGRWMRALWT